MFSKIPFTTRLLFSALAITSLFSKANNLEKNSSKPSSMEYLIVSGTRSEQASIEIPASMQIITAEQISISGASNLATVLNAQAGFAN